MTLLPSLHTPVACPRQHGPITAPTLSSAALLGGGSGAGTQAVLGVGVSMCGERACIWCFVRTSRHRRHSHIISSSASTTSVPGRMVFTDSSWSIIRSRSPMAQTIRRSDCRAAPGCLLGRPSFSKCPGLTSGAKGQHLLGRPIQSRSERPHWKDCKYIHWAGPGHEAEPCAHKDFKRLAGARQSS